MCAARANCNVHSEGKYTCLQMCSKGCQQLVKHVSSAPALSPAASAASSACERARCAWLKGEVACVCFSECVGLMGGLCCCVFVMASEDSEMPASSAVMHVSS
jgi:hypothetical protein